MTERSDPLDPATPLDPADLAALAAAIQANFAAESGVVFAVQHGDMHIHSAGAAAVPDADAAPDPAPDPPPHTGTCAPMITHRSAGSPK